LGVISKQLAKTAIATPAYQEWENLIGLKARIAEVRPYFCSLEWVIVCESDASAEVIAQVTSDSDWVHVFKRPDGAPEFGNALSLSVQIARELGDVVITMDGDGSHQPEEIPRLVEVLVESEAAAVIASRYVSGGSSDNPALLKAMSKILNLIFAVSLRMKVKDISNNFRAVRSDCLPGMALKQRNFDAVEELLLHVKYKGAGRPIVEIESHFNERLHGESKRRLGPFIISYIYAIIRVDVKVRRLYSK